MLNSKNYAQGFCEARKDLIKKYAPVWGKVKMCEIEGMTVLELPSPQLLAGFSSYLKYHYPGKVYFRGEKQFHRSTIPSLFRHIHGDVTGDIVRRKQAFDDLVTSLQSLYSQTRFREDFRPLLQHYGIRTDWLDLVDNIFVALWFSNHYSREEFSYIKFFGDSGLTVVDLRSVHSSLSLRPHCQHGLSATKLLTAWDVNSIDFSQNMIAIAKLQNTPEMKLSGHIFSDEYMFPKEELDNTLKLLKAKKFQDNLDKILTRNGLPRNTLGSVQ